MNNRYHKKGDIIILTSGEYSDYSIDAIMFVKKDFDFDGVGFLYLKEYPEESKRFKQKGFLAWLSNNGYAEDADDSVREVYIGCYSRHAFKVGKDALDK